MTIVLLAKSCSSYWKKTATSTLKSDSSEHILRPIFRTRNREVVMLDLILESHSAVFRLLIANIVNPCIQSSTIKSTNYLFLSRCLDDFSRILSGGHDQDNFISISIIYFFFSSRWERRKAFFEERGLRDTINIIFYVIFQSESVESRLLHYSDASEKSFRRQIIDWNETNCPNANISPREAWELSGAWLITIFITFEEVNKNVRGEHEWWFSPKARRRNLSEAKIKSFQGKIRILLSQANASFTIKKKFLRKRGEFGSDVSLFWVSR